jgi:hypothetical protein
MLMSRINGSGRLAIAIAAISLVSASSVFGQALAISLGVRETGSSAEIGQPGGTNNGIEWINRDGLNLVADGTWQTFTWNFGTDPVQAFAGATANGVLDGTRGVLEHLRINNSVGTIEPFTVYIDNITQNIGGTEFTIQNWESAPVLAPGPLVQQDITFQEPRFSGTSNTSLTTAFNANHTTDETAAEGLNSYRLQFQFIDPSITRWIRLTTFNAVTGANPTIDFAPGSTLSMSLRAVITPSPAGWNVDTDGNWSDANNWDLNGRTIVPGTDSAIASGPDAQARLKAVTTGPRNINLDVPVFLNSLVFRGTQTYTVVGTDNPITLLGPAGVDGTVVVEAGDHVIDANVQANIRTSFSVQGGASLDMLKGFAVFIPETQDMLKNGDGLLKINQFSVDLLAVNGGTIQVKPDQATATKVQRHTLAGGFTPTVKLDITNNGLIVDYDEDAVLVPGDPGSAADPRPNPLSILAAQIASAYNGGDWAGSGLTSSSAAANPNFAIGYLDNALLDVPLTEFLGTSVTGDSYPSDVDAVLIRYTRKGDTDLNGVVEFADLLSLAQNYDPSFDPEGEAGPKRWINGDSDYTGIVDFNDLLALAQNYGPSAITAGQYNQLVNASSHGFAAFAVSVIPEPATLGLMAGVGLLALRRR